jgi:hypothetical protein
MKSNNIAKGGIFAALSLILLYFSSIFPTNRLFILGIASAIIPISIIMTGIKNTIVVYSAISILGLFIIPSKLIIISYILIFGSYGFMKYYIERLRSIILEIILKLLYFNINSAIIISIYNSVLKVPNINMYLLIISLQFCFIVYDYTLTAFISYANKKIQISYIHKKS